MILLAIDENGVVAVVVLAVVPENSPVECPACVEDEDEDNGVP